MRLLSPEEKELWARVASTIRPLSRDMIRPEPVEETVRRTVPIARRAAQEPAQQSSAKRPIAIADKTLDGSWDKKLRSGSATPDRVIDLHGMNLDRAWNAIDRGLDEAIHRGDRIVLLITGHHRAGEPPIERGKIRAAVHDWLAASRHASDIAAVREAHRRHGGGGSLYLVLRRAVSPR